MYVHVCGEANHVVDCLAEEGSGNFSILSWVETIAQKHRASGYIHTFYWIKQAFIQIIVFVN